MNEYRQVRSSLQCFHLIHLQPNLQAGGGGGGGGGVEVKMKKTEIE